MKILKNKSETKVNPGSSYTGSQSANSAINTVTESIKDNIRSNYLNELFASAKNHNRVIKIHLMH